MKLTVDNLSFERNYQYLFEKINFELNAGELLYIVGANGSGKTTLLRMLAGLIYVEEGIICWNDQSIFDDFKNYQKNMNYIGHQNGIRLYLNSEENARWFCAINKNDWIASQRTLAMTDQNHSSLRRRQLGAFQTSFTKSQKAIHLSAGQKRRLALSRLTLSPAPLWILDEPTTALDSESQLAFFNLLKKHLSKGGIAIITSHYDLPENFNPKKIFLGKENHA